MKKLAFAIGLGAYIVFGSSSGALAAYRVDNTAGVATARDSRIAWSETATNARLLFLNEAFYPDTMTQPSTSRTDTERMLCSGDICLVL